MGRPRGLTSWGQHEIAEAIVAGGADYVLAVKDKLPTLVEAIRQWFAVACQRRLEIRMC